MKVPEKLEYYQGVEVDVETVIIKVNEVIDYLNSKEQKYGLGAKTEHGTIIGMGTNTGI